MPKVRLTKNELKKQKDNIRMFNRYLPMLQLKKQQLQVEILKIYKKIEDTQMEIQTFKDGLNTWADVFAEEIGINPVRGCPSPPGRITSERATTALGRSASNGVKDLIIVNKVNISTGNIAGIDIPVLFEIEFKEKEYDFITIPIWVDYGIIAMKRYITLKINYRILGKQLDVIREELRITTQRVNLFEKVKIPEAEENIRRIQIYLGDMQTSAVVIGKIAKNKIERKQEVLVS